MPETEKAITPAEGESPDDESGYIVLSADRTPEEKREAYAIKWREPANRLSFMDKIRNLL